MSELEKLLNDPDTRKETSTPKPAKKTAAVNKTNVVTAQDNAIAAASLGGAAFRSASDFLAAKLEGKAYRRK